MKPINELLDKMVALAALAGSRERDEAMLLAALVREQVAAPQAEAGEDLRAEACNRDCDCVGYCKAGLERAQPAAQGGDGWVFVEDALPGRGQRIVGRNESGFTWQEVYDPSEPLGRMTHWRPAALAPQRSEAK